MKLTPSSFLIIFLLFVLTSTTAHTEIIEAETLNIRYRNEAKDREVAPTKSIRDNSGAPEKQTAGMKNGLIKITRIRLEGDALYPEYGITNKFINTRVNQLFSYFDDKMDMAAINKIADAITLMYREKGLTFNRAFVVPQEIKKSTLTIYVLKGVLAEIDIYDNNLYSNQQLKSPFKKLLGKVIYEPDVMSVVDNLNKMPGLKLFAYFSTGSKQGEARLNIKVKKETATENKILIDNKGIRETGHNRVMVSHTQNNVFSQYGQINASFVKSNKENNVFGGISYQAPISEDRKLGVSLVQSDFSITGKFSSLGLKGTLTAISSFLSKEIEEKESVILKQTSQVLFSYKDSKVTSKAFPDILNETTRYATANSYHQRQYSFSDDSQHHISIKPSIGAIDASSDPSISERFFSIGANYQFFLFNPVSIKKRNNLLSVRVAAKWSDDKLPAPERFSTTGPAVNRGYKPGILSGDTGYSVSTEYTLDWNTQNHPQMRSFKLQTSLFIDYSYGKMNEKETFDGAFSSMGVAVNSTFRKQISLGVSLAMPLDHSISQDLGINADSPVVYAHASITF